MSVSVSVNPIQKLPDTGHQALCPVSTRACVHTCERVGEGGGEDGVTSH